MAAAMRAHSHQHAIFAMEKHIQCENHLRVVARLRVDLRGPRMVNDGRCTWAPQSSIASVAGRCRDLIGHDLSGTKGMRPDFRLK